MISRTGDLRLLYRPALRFPAVGDIPESGRRLFRTVNKISGLAVCIAGGYDLAACTASSIRSCRILP